ncbi:MAG: ferritin-like domain-containing protein, partial [Candidatus Saccharimonadales bacterium]
MVQTKFFSKQSEVTPANLGEAIQQAIEIEIATIPVYLYTYYSINRVPDQDAISGEIVQALTKAGKSLAEASAIALDLSASIMVYANKAGALIMSVAIEEMLHMALASNLKQALAGLPQLAGKSPNVWPAFLPGHIPPFPINREKFSLEQLMTFLKIESPDPLPDPKALKAIEYKTIGQFYGMIKDC